MYPGSAFTAIAELLRTLLYVALAAAIAGTACAGACCAIRAAWHGPARPGGRAHAPTAGVLHRKPLGVTTTDM